MINTALVEECIQFNDFTRRLAEKCNTNGSALVQLRNNALMEVEFYDQSEGRNDLAIFRSVDGEHLWYADGSNQQSYVYDMLMIGSKKLLSNKWEEYL